MDSCVDKLLSSQYTTLVRQIEFFMMAKSDSGSHKLFVCFPRKSFLRSKVAEHRIDIYDSRRLQTEVGTMSAVLV